VSGSGDDTSAPETGLAEAPAPEADLLAGHRERVRERFLKVGGEAFTDVELLEAVLHIVVPRRDTKKLAKELINRFGSFSDVFAAPPAQLREFRLLGDTTIAHLKVLQAAAQRFARDKVDRQNPILSSWSELLDYCRTTMAYESVEQFRILFLDKKNRLIADEVQQRGTVDHTPVYTREIIKRALEHGATALILLHNHPSGDPAPSTADVRMTREIINAAQPIGITIHDHVIIGRSGHASMKGLRLI
jgi:DNA repair protein RadC